jgi:hypothetical protein
METMNESQRQEALLDAALDAYPLTPLPAGFVRATMARLAPPVRFRLHFLDVALPFGFALLIATLFGLFLWLRGTISLSGLPAPAFATLPAANIGAVSWPAMIFLIVLAEVACLLAGVVSFAWWDGGTIRRG